MPDAIGRALTDTSQNSCIDLRCDRHGKPWKLSTNGYTFMAVLESGILNGTNYLGQRVVDGFIVQVYNDGYGIPTVGFGHKVTPQDNLHVGDVIPVDRARNFFKKNLMSVEAAINREVKVFLHQYEYDALVSVLFNTGENHSKVDAWYPETRCHHLAAYLNRGEYKEMGDVIRSFIAQRVPKRRKSEAKLFETGIYDASH